MGVNWSQWPWSKSQPQPQIIENHDPQSLIKSTIVGATGLASKTDDLSNIGNYAVAAAFSVIYTKVAKYRKEVVSEVEKLKDFYLTDVIINQFTDDALSPDTSTEDVISVYSNNADINKKLEEFQKKFNLDSLVSNITPDLLVAGDYTVKPKVEVGMGVTEINDTVDQETIIPIDKNGEISGYLVSDGGKLKIADKTEYINFSLNSKKIRIDLHKELLQNRMVDKEKLNSLPRYIRVGKSLIYPIRSKIKELELLEKLVPATKLSKLSQGTVIGVSVPSGYPVDQAMEVAKRMEGLLNKKMGVDTSMGQITMEDIMTAAGKLKVIPIFGDKGNISRFDYKQEEPDDLLNTVDATRSVIFNSIGVPAELIFGSESASKGEILKRYARYVRKLKNIQKALADGIRDLVYLHLTNLGVTFTPDDVKISFRNKLVDVDNLNKLEFLDTTVSMLQNIMNFITSLKDFNMEIDDDHMKEFMNSQLGIVGLEGLIKSTSLPKSLLKSTTLNGNDRTSPPIDKKIGGITPSKSKAIGDFDAGSGEGDFT